MKPQRIQLSRKKRMADCHPNRPHTAKGLCSSCYHKILYSRPDLKAKKDAQKSAWGRRNRERLRRIEKASHLRRAYGITIEQFDCMLTAQSGLCAICKKSTVLHVDHDHITGKVRQLICLPCNGSIAWLERIRRADEVWLSEANAYLARHA